MVDSLTGDDPCPENVLSMDHIYDSCVQYSSVPGLTDFGEGGWRPTEGQRQEVLIAIPVLSICEQGAEE